MPNLRNLTAATALDEDDLFYGVVGGADRKVSLALIRAELAAVVAHLPATIYVTEGEELNVYFGNLVESALPLSGLRFDIRNQASAYAIPVGTHYGKRWSWTPTGASTEALRLEVHFGGGAPVTRDFTVEAVAASAGAANTRRVLVIGDSTATLLSGNGYGCAELENLGAEHGPSMVTVGRLSGSANDQDGTPRSVANEATGGLSARNYWDNSGTGSAFFSGGVFDFAQYLTDNAITLSAGDWIVFALGINDIASGVGETDISTRVSNYIAAINGMIAAMKADVSGLKFAVCTVLPTAGDPADPRQQQDGFGAPYGAANASQDYQEARWALLSAQIATYDGREAEDIYLVPMHAVVDPEHGFPVTTPAASAYTTATETRFANGVHPNASGLYQAYNAVFNVMKAQE